MINPLLIFSHVAIFSLGAVFGYKVLSWKLDSKTMGIFDVENLDKEIEDELENLGHKNSKGEKEDGR